MYLNFGVPLALTIIGIGFVALMFGLQKLLAPQNPYDRKLIPYECGEPPTGRACLLPAGHGVFHRLVHGVFRKVVQAVLPMAVSLSSISMKIISPGPLLMTSCSTPALRK